MPGDIDLTPEAPSEPAAKVQIDDLENELPDKDDLSHFLRDPFLSSLQLLPPLPRIARTEDLSHEVPTPGKGLAEFAREQTLKYDRNPHPVHRVRGWLVALLIGPMPVIALVGLAGSLLQRAGTGELSERLLAVFAGIGGAIVGFYFGERSQ